jgi:hypothetical protein
MDDFLRTLPAYPPPAMVSHPGQQSGSKVKDVVNAPPVSASFFLIPQIWGIKALFFLSSPNLGSSNHGKLDSLPPPQTRIFQSGL